MFLSCSFFIVFLMDTSPWRLSLCVVFLWLSLTLLSQWTLFAAFVYIAIFALTDVKPFKQTNSNKLWSLFSIILTVSWKSIVGGLWAWWSGGWPGWASIFQKFGFVGTEIRNPTVVRECCRYINYRLCSRTARPHFLSSLFYLCSAFILYVNWMTIDH